MMAEKAEKIFNPHFNPPEITKSLFLATSNTTFASSTLGGLPGESENVQSFWFHPNPSNQINRVHRNILRVGESMFF